MKIVVNPIIKMIALAKYGQISDCLAWKSQMIVIFRRLELLWNQWGERHMPPCKFGPFPSKFDKRDLFLLNAPEISNSAGRFLKSGKKIILSLYEDI